MKLTPARRKVLARANEGELIVSQPRGNHLPYEPAYWSAGRETVDGRVLHALVDAGYLDTQRDGVVGAARTHEITFAGRQALSSQ